MSEANNGSTSTPFYKNPMILGGIFVVVVIIGLIIYFAMSGDSKTPIPSPSPAPAPVSSYSPPAVVSAPLMAAATTSMTPATAASCKSFVDAKTCPPASATTCSSFITAEATRVTGLHKEPWCKSTYATLRTVSPFCIKVRNELTYASAAIKTVFSRVNANYLKRVTKVATATSSSENTEFFLVEEAGMTINSLELAEAKSTAANKYLLPASGAALYTTTVTTTPTNFPKFDADNTKLSADIRAKSTAISTTMWRRAMTNETSMSLVKAMYLPSVWTQVYQTTDKTKTYYKLDANKLATEFEKITKALPESDYNQFCGTD